MNFEKTYKTKIIRLTNLSILYIYNNNMPYILIIQINTQ